VKSVALVLPFALAASLLVGGAACSSSSSSPPCAPGAAGVDTGGAFPSSLSAYCQVSIQNAQVTPSSGVTPYDLNTPLFSDYAVKYRTVWMPAGVSAPYQDTGTFALPVGTVLTKSFGWPADFRDANAPVKWVETRVYVHAASGWKGTSYIWDDAQQNAQVSAGGEIDDFSFIDTSGQTLTPHYLIPSQSECPKCHANDGSAVPLGPRAEQINKDFAYSTGTENELAHWAKAGLLSGAPTPSAAPVMPVWDDPTTGSVDARARAYLQANCSYCHDGNGEARTTGLVLLETETSPSALGECKPPIAAGKAAQGETYDIVPGQPDQSILIYRVTSTEPSIAMPEIGRSLEHVECVALLTQWIAGMTGMCASATGP
jgi:uncharacterized repeat protein (TIGR03806 family)